MERLTFKVHRQQQRSSTTLVLKVFFFSCPFPITGTCYFQQGANGLISCSAAISACAADKEKPVKCTRGSCLSLCPIRFSEVENAGNPAKKKKTKAASHARGCCRICDPTIRRVALYPWKPTGETMEEKIQSNPLTGPRSAALREC